MSKRQKLLAKQREHLDRMDRSATAAIDAAEDVATEVEDRSARRLAARAGGRR